MLEGWRYRLAASLGVVALALTAVLIANMHAVQTIVTDAVPLLRRLEPTIIGGRELYVATLLTVGIVWACLLPLYKPQPRRRSDTVFIAQQRIALAGFVLATLGYFNYSYRLPRPTLAIIVALLAVTVPVWFLWIRERPRKGTVRAVLVGDDPHQFVELADSADLSFVGQICPASIYRELPSERIVADGGQPLDRLGGLSKLHEVLVEHDIDTAVVAFREPDRGDFFGTLDTCYDHGVDVKVHRRFAGSVMTTGDGGELLLDVDIEPWDPQDYLFKRGFDIVFAAVALIATLPLTAAIAVAIKLDDGGPILYRQERSSDFGNPFPIYKFRTMVEDAESDGKAVISEEDAGGFDPRVTMVGRFLRRTHLDEIPQLWSILVGHMSVVGPRPERPELEHTLLNDSIDWEKRWFVKPGLTGLAQINGVTGHDPREKLRYDLEYIRNQSIVYDVKIVIRQFWAVFSDLREVVTG